jgi:N-acetylmuramoyl-L-alanine amidase
MTKLGAAIGRKFAQANQKYVVVLNAGHGGNTDNDSYDPGSIAMMPDGTPIHEAEITHKMVAEIAVRVVALGGAAPIIVNWGGVDTPQRSYFWELVQRCNAAGGDFLISHHTNALNGIAPPAGKLTDTEANVTGTFSMYASEHGRVMANYTSLCTTQALGGNRTLRKDQQVAKGQRGALLLTDTVQYATLVEHCYPTNKYESTLLFANWRQLIDNHARYVVHLQNFGVGTADRFVL